MSDKKEATMQQVSGDFWTVRHYATVPYFACSCCGVIVAVADINLSFCPACGVEVKEIILKR